MSATPDPRTFARRSPSHVIGGTHRPAPDETELQAWLYDVHKDGTSHPTWGDGWRREVPEVTRVPRSAVLHASADVGRNTARDRYLRLPPADGMATEPATVSPDPDTGHWTIRNGGRTNPLRVQPYGLRAIPLRPRASLAMPGEDVAVWIPIVPRGGRAEDRTETFRLLILHAPEPIPRPGGTTYIIGHKGPERLTGKQREALIALFGEHLSWPPLPTPHVRQESEIKKIAEEHALLGAGARSPHWPRNCHENLSGRDGMFVIASRNGYWYPPLGGAERTAANYLPAVQRLIELGAITLRSVWEWAHELSVEAFVNIDVSLLL